MAEFERELGWDDEISNDSTFTLLPAGDYNFEVIGFERGRHNGSDKLPACNKAILTLELSDGINTVQIKHNLMLHTKTEGLVCAFFVAIGQRKHGEPLRMNWPAVVGSTGRCKVGIRQYNGNDYIEIKKFYEPGSGDPSTAASSAPSASFAPTFQAGAF